ncbi:hypothetical protein BKA65DRAFT_291985 [Rhexocercosporidium sp. MPI-PUGE-AT-0058]|nr:hypothetical protein BKA65DRAFT_291985 [Rhexocercosporidium sp. MPI-PUGE-AT-0058]
MGRFNSNPKPPILPLHSKKVEKQTAKEIRAAQQKSFTFHSKRLCQHSDWEYIRSYEDDLPLQREAEPAKENILALKNNQTYSQSGIIQSYGKLNLGDDICGCCARVFALGRTRTWRGCVSFPIDLEYPGRPEGSVPFQGQCANCHWGSQGWKCSIRVGGVKIPPRHRRADLFQSSIFTNTHLGSKHDLNTTAGCADARNELQGILNQLSRRSKKIQNGRKTELVEDENAQIEEEEDDDGDASVCPVITESTTQTTSTRRTRQSKKMMASTGSRAAIVKVSDDDDYVGPSKFPALPQRRRTRRSSKSSTRPSKSGIGIEVIIPPFQPPHKRLSRRTSSFNF